MQTNSGTAPESPPRARRIWLMFVVATVAGAVLVSPYALLDADSSRLDTGDGTHYGLLVAHIFTALVALVLGPLQFIPAIRRNPRVHRTIGRVYLGLGVLPSAVTAIPVAILSGRLITQVGLTIPAVLWLATGALAYRAARRRDFAEHRAWMTRNYALTFLAVTSRMVVPLLLLGRFLTVGIDDRAAAVTAAIPYGQVLGWAVNLAVAEYLLRRSPRASAD
ncbi:DUF2306 domain-containing protein [Actinomadura atramentaria]|uniref:DUF2306 domain-containing protein n=1 Tax=Actinomadura atramentaria TaxID=1990 RepID=UPI0003605D6F|nr:DUF2306 domain-containing protein [Actinomadura atramentaria]